MGGEALGSSEISPVTVPQAWANQLRYSKRIISLRVPAGGGAGNKLVTQMADTSTNCTKHKESTGETRTRESSEGREKASKYSIEEQENRRLISNFDPGQPFDGTFSDRSPRRRGLRTCVLTSRCCSPPNSGGPHPGWSG